MHQNDKQIPAFGGLPIEAIPITPLPVCQVQWVFADLPDFVGLYTMPSNMFNAIVVPVQSGNEHRMSLTPTLHTR
jgi:hypothetical protein